MLCLVRRKLIFEKYFFAFMSVWSDGKCWLTRNYFPVDCKIKTFMIEIDLSFHFLFHPKLLTEPPPLTLHYLPPNHHPHHRSPIIIF